jgi:exodeoxyribonuclease-5
MPTSARSKPGVVFDFVKALAKKRGADQQLGLFDMPKPAFGIDDLSDDQRVVYEGIVTWLRRTTNSRLLTVGGYAGTGKSSILGVFAYEHQHLLIAFATYTGRAASVLQRKLRAAGVETTSLQAPPENTRFDNDQLYLPYEDRKMPFCGTLHKLLYAPILNGKEEVVGWRKREKLDRKYDLIVVDEASMVGDDMLLDLQHHNVPILAVGDHGQLPPVMSSGNLMASPELRLVKIHRQAKTNPIILFARHVRKTGVLDERFADGHHIVFDRRQNVDSVLQDAYEAVDSAIDVALLCWTNKQRNRLNLAARKTLTFKGPPNTGEMVICLKNMRDENADVYNGMRGVVQGDCMIVPGEWAFDASIAFPEESIKARDFRPLAPQFNRERVFAEVDELKAIGVNVDTLGGLDLFDWGYALTVHKSQGSQMKHVIFYVEDGAKNDLSFWKKMAYTAVTRASERLTVLV